MQELQEFRDERRIADRSRMGRSDSWGRRQRRSVVGGRTNYVQPPSSDYWTIG